MKMIAKLIGGSHLYGLENKDSDIDYRGVFLNEKVSNILGLDKHENETDRKNDKVYYELRRYLSLLKKTNTQMLEILFAPEASFTLITNEFREIREYAYQLIDSYKLFKSLCGYIYRETRLFKGERTGKLGGKRHCSLQKYGYSYKNFVQLVRLCNVGTHFYKTGIYEVKIEKIDNEVFNLLKKVKNNPKEMDKLEAEILVNIHINNLKEAYNNTKINYNFDQSIANSIIYKNYMPILENFNFDL